MKHRFLRRICAAALCLVMALGLAAPSLAEDDDDAGPGEGDEPAVAASITLDNTELEIVTGKTATLHATTTPPGVDVVWSSSNSDVAEVDNNGHVTAVSAGPATITAAAGEKTASCIVTVRDPVYVREIYFSSDEIQFNYPYEEKSISVTVVPSIADYDSFTFDSEDVDIVTAVQEPSTDTEDYPNYARLTPVGPGETYVTAALNGLKGQDRLNALRCRVVVSGIVLTVRENGKDRRLDEELDSNPLELTMGTSVNVSVTTYGDAKNTSTVDWYSEDNSVVSVASGRLTPRSPGKSRITAMRGNYSVSFNVTVVEDTSRLIVVDDSISAGTPYNLQSVRRDLYDLCEEVLYDEVTGDTHTLSYITSLSVSPEQGVLYHGYISESDTGAGVSMAQRYYYSSSNSDDYRIGDLTFVPRSTFSGTAEISFTAVASDGSNFSGIIRIPIDAMEDVSYTTGSRQNVFFLGSDFNTVCRANTGRELASVTFTPPDSSRGTLYYNYTTSGQYSEKVEAGTSYRRVGNPNIDSVSFLPSDNFSGSVRISYRGLDTAGASFSGYVTVNVTNLDSGDADVVFTGRAGREVSFTASRFNTACRNATGETLDYVQFDLPLTSEGTLYYSRGGNSERKVSENTRYYRNSTPSIGSISFVPAQNAPQQVRIFFSGRSTEGTNFSGTVLIDYDGTTTSSGQQTAYYTVYAGRAVQFEAADFNSACRDATGRDLQYVRFDLPSTAQGLLCYDYGGTSTAVNRVSASTRYYRSTSGSSNSRLDRVWFLADSGYAGTVNISYTGYSTSGESFTGTVTVRVNSITPAEVSFSGTGSQAISLVSSQMRYACNAVMDNELSYIQFTSLPSSSTGKLYRDYNGFDTGIQVVTGTQYYVSGTPGIDQLSFVPRGGFSGTATATYTGVSTSGEIVTGRINFVVSSSGASSYFSDMGAYSWAAAAVDYMQQNGVISGIGNGQYGPGLDIRRCDFVVMLCRAYGFNDGTNEYTFADVPSDSYYASAISAAARRGIVSGDGTNFFPDSQLTRQDAMVMIKNTLERAGWSLSSGSVSELSYFGDGGTVASYAQEAVATLVRLGAVNGDTSGNLRPWDPVNRAEAAVMLHFVMTM